MKCPVVRPVDRMKPRLLMNMDQNMNMNTGRVTNLDDFIGLSYAKTNSTVLE